MRIFFENKFFEFVQVADYEQLHNAHKVGGREIVYRPDKEIELTPELLLDQIGSESKMVILSENPKECFDRFCSCFVVVRAAGGVVENDLGEVLMMTRKGWPDLPKGHIDEGETAEQAAVREVAEETGLSEVEIVAPLCTTCHFHNAYGRWEIKQTEWFAMHAPGEAPEVWPQTDEGITAVEWMHGRRLWKAVDKSYSTIKTLFEKWLEYKIQ